nr:helix-turn-helix domain-containing protein [Halomonas sp. MCCC 1A11062]
MDLQGVSQVNCISPAVRSAEIWLSDKASHRVSMRHLADYLGYSESHLRRLFTNHFGYSPGRYRDLLRLERAAMLLARTRLPIIEIAIQCGYSSHPVFTRAFRHKHGSSPRTFRQQFEHYQQVAISRLRQDVFDSCRPRIVKNAKYELYLARHYGKLDLKAQQHTWLHYTRRTQLSSQHRSLIQPAWIYHDDPDITPGERLRTDLGYRAMHPYSLPTERFFHRIRIESKRAVTARFDKPTDIEHLRTYLTLVWLPQHGESIDGNATSVLFDAADGCCGSGTLTIPLLH